MRSKRLEEDYKYIMFDKLMELFGDNSEENKDKEYPDELKAAVKAILGKDLNDGDPFPKLPPEEKKKRRD